MKMSWIVAALITPTTMAEFCLFLSVG